MRIKAKVLWLLLLYVLFALKIHNLLHSTQDDVIVASPDENDGIVAFTDRGLTLDMRSMGHYLYENNRGMSLRSGRRKPFTEPLCRRRDHVVYIKTHKTGSTTLVNLFWRYRFFVSFCLFCETIEKFEFWGDWKGTQECGLPSWFWLVL